MSHREPIERFVDTPAGPFRVLEWPGEGDPVLLLHGLTATADAWQATVDALPGYHCYAMDERGHGESPKPASGYTVADFARDVVAVTRALKLERPHLAGHSMGARIAFITAARNPVMFRSTAIIDIGPEQWRQNWEESVTGFDRMPASFPDRAATLAYLARGRELTPEGERNTLARTKVLPGGTFTWRGSFDAMKQTVVSHRSTGHWRDWERAPAPLLLIRGGTSRELRPHIAEEMRRRNPLAFFREFPDTGHNIPAIAPGLLAETLAAFWTA